MARTWQRLVAVLTLCILWHGGSIMAQQVELSAAAGDSVVATQQAIKPHRDRKPVILTDSTASDPNSRPVRVINAAGDTVIFASIDSIRGIEGVEILMDSTASPQGAHIQPRPATRIVVVGTVPRTRSDL